MKPEKHSNPLYNGLVIRRNSYSLQRPLFLIPVIIVLMMINGCISGFQLTGVRMAINEGNDKINMLSFIKQEDLDNITNETFHLVMKVDNSETERFVSNFYHSGQYIMINSSNLTQKIINKPLEGHTYKLNISIEINSTEPGLTGIHFFGENNSVMVKITRDKNSINVVKGSNITDIEIKKYQSLGSSHVKILKELWIDIMPSGYIVD